MYSDYSGCWTISINLNLNINVYIGASVSIGFCFDSNWDFGFQWSYSQPFDSNTSNIGLFDAGISATMQITELDSIHKLEGVFSYVGASLGSGLYVSFDLISNGKIADMDSEVIGIQFGIGYGIGIDVHLMQTYTSEIYYF